MTERDKPNPLLARSDKELVVMWHANEDTLRALDSKLVGLRGQIRELMQREEKLLEGFMKVSAEQREIMDIISARHNRQSGFIELGQDSETGEHDNLP